MGLKYRLALDLGSTSLGWSMLHLDKDKRPDAIVKAGVRIFSDGRNPKDGTSLAVTRREARAARRRRDRLLKRKARLSKQLIDLGFFPQDEAERKKLEQLNPYELRAKGLDSALTPAEFARALFHINQRRGFKSNRKTDRLNKETGPLKTAIATLLATLAETNCRTVGEWLYQRLQKGETVRARLRETKTQREDGRTRTLKNYDLYIDRAMVEQEFDCLWAKQAEFTPHLFTDEARAQLRDTLLFQRPLRPVAPGKCTLIPTEKRAPLALPSQQLFRIYQEVNNLRWIDASFHQHPLDRDQRDKLVSELNRKNKLTFKQVRKLLKLQEDCTFNLEDEKRSELKGNATNVILAKKELFGDRWYDLSLEQKTKVVNKLLNEESEAELLQWLIDHHQLEEPKAQKIADASLPEGYGRLSEQAINKILPFLKQFDENNVPLTYDKAVVAAGFANHSSFGFDFDHEATEIEAIAERIDGKTGEITQLHAFKTLPYYGRALHRHVTFGTGEPSDIDEKRYGKIANPTVHIGLNQLRLVVNQLISRYGRPQEIIVELARDLKQSQTEREAVQRQQAQNQKRNERISKDIAAVLNINEDSVSSADIKKWILWEELNPGDPLNRRCPYTGIPISKTMLMGDEVEIEHIFPFSKTLDNSMNNKTVCLRPANRVKGDRSPWEARNDFENEGWLYEDILSRARNMPKAKAIKFAERAFEQWSENNDFLARALNDTRYLSRMTAMYLQLICPGQVHVIPGQMTALLRAKFGLNHILGLDGEKNRNDHRHHAVDACVIGVTDRVMLQRFALANQATREKGINRLVECMPEPWDKYLESVRKAVNAIHVSHKPNHGHEAGFLEATAYGIDRNGNIIQKNKPNETNGEKSREVKNLILINEPSQIARHGTDKKGNPRTYKGYLGGSNYCIEITRQDSGQWQGEVISSFEAYRIVNQHKDVPSGQQKLRHPTLGKNGKPLVMRLMINDCVQLELESKKTIMRIVKINKSNENITLAQINEANVDARNRSSTDPFKYINKAASKLQKAKAIYVLISPIGLLSKPKVTKYAGPNH